MEPRDSCGLRADGRVSYSASPSRAGRSSQSTWSPTPTTYASSTWRSSASDERSVQDRVTLFDAALVQRHALPGAWAGTACLWIDGQTEVRRPSLVAPFHHDPGHVVGDGSRGVDRIELLVDAGGVLAGFDVARMGYHLHLRVGIDQRHQAGKLRQRSEERRVGKECRSRWSPYH